MALYKFCIVLYCNVHLLHYKVIGLVLKSLKYDKIWGRVRTIAPPVFDNRPIGPTYFTFFHISKKHDFLSFFAEMACQEVVNSRQQKFSPQSSEMSSHSSLSDHCNSFQLFVSLVYIVSCECEHYIRICEHRPMSDVGDLPVGLLTFGNCVLKTGVIKWRLKMYVRFFFKIQKHDFFTFLSRCTRFLEH